MLIKCSQCRKEIYRKPYSIKHYKNHYCGMDCQSIAKVTSVAVFCKKCNRKFLRKKSELNPEGNHFCSQSCANSVNNKKARHYKDGSGSYRARAIRLLGLGCNNEDCELTKNLIEIPEFMFDVDHVNGKRNGHNIDNLQILCLWCHGLKTRNKLQSIR